MNIQDLQKLDFKNLKNLDIAKIQEEILGKPDLAINGALVLLSLFVMFQMVISRQLEIHHIKGQLEEMEKKGAALDTYQTSQKQLNDFIKSLPTGIQEDKVIDELTDIAANRNVQILSFSPAQMEKKKYYNKIVVNLNIVAKNYKNICLFANDIEQSPYALRLERWQGSMETPNQNQATADSTDQENFIAQLTVASINIKNDDK